MIPVAAVWTELDPNGLPVLQAEAVEEEEPEVISLPPMKLDDLLSPIPVDPDEQLS